MSIARALMSYAQSRGRSLDGLYEALAAQRAQRQASPSPRAPASRGTRAPAGPARGVDRSGNVLVLPTQWKGTHRTDGAEWNKQGATAIDIMGRPGTVVGAPEPGRVVRHGSAQGGQALYFDSLADPDDDPDYWYGHIGNMVPVGTVVRKRGGRIASISPDHPRPHVHADRIGR